MSYQLPKVNLDATWDDYCTQVQRRIAHCDFQVAKVFTEHGNSVCILLVGDSRRSRLVALFESDARGTVRVLEDDCELFGWDKSVPKTAKTIGIVELTEQFYPGVVSHLELDKHHNHRLLIPTAQA